MGVKTHVKLGLIAFPPVRERRRAMRVKTHVKAGLITYPPLTGQVGV